MLNSVSPRPALPTVFPISRVQIQAMKMNALPPFPHPQLRHLTPCMFNGVLQFPVYAMRGGTSTGIVLWERHVPHDTVLREELIRHIMGVPQEGEAPGDRQLTGLGRGTPTSNKVFLVEVERPSQRITSTLAQLAAGRSAIDWSVNCGNMSAALPLFALDTGLIETNAAAEDQMMTIHNRNTGGKMSAQVHWRANGQPDDVAIPGVLGCHPAVDLYLHDPVGAKTGALLPTGRVIERIAGVEASCVDVAVPMVIVSAADLGKSGDESPAELDADEMLKARLRDIWTEAGLRMGLRGPGGVPLTAAQLAASETIPKICMVAPARHGGTLSVRYFTPQQAHASLAVSGGCCLAAACLLPGTVAHKLARPQAVRPDGDATHHLHLENPAGVLTSVLDARSDASVPGGIRIVRAAYRRSAQVLMRGHVPLPHASLLLRAYYSG